MDVSAKSLGIDRLSLAERILLVEEIEEIWEASPPRPKHSKSLSPIRTN